MGRSGWEFWGSAQLEDELVERQRMLRRLRAAVIVARGTGRMRQLRVTSERVGPGDLKNTLSLALARGELGEARAALRRLRAADFDGDAEQIEAALGVVRDLRSCEDDVAEAVRQLCALAPPA